jgi:predicted DNA-binding transcriptional regulator AlpA
MGNADTRSPTVSNRGHQLKEAAEILGVGRTTFGRLAKAEPLLQPIRLGPSLPIWTDNILQTYLAAKESERVAGCEACQ